MAATLSLQFTLSLDNLDIIGRALRLRPFLLTEADSVDVHNTQNSTTAALDRGLRSKTTPPNSEFHYSGPRRSPSQETRRVHRAQISITVPLATLDRRVHFELAGCACGGHL